MRVSQLHRSIGTDCPSISLVWNTIIYRVMNAYWWSGAIDKELRGMSSLLNRAINALSFELHIPGYQFCSPGTHLEKRLTRGDRGINSLYAACREHDIVYSHSNDLAERHVADNILATKASKRIAARDSTLGKRVAAVWTAMKAKKKSAWVWKQRRRRM